MATSNRPLSPHLQIYRLPMLMLLSITHRGTGFVLSTGAILIPLVLMGLASGPESYQDIQRHLSAWYGQLLLFLLSTTLMFHLLNGIRHLVWDTGRNFAVKNAEKSGIAVMALTLLLTAGLWALVWIAYSGGVA